MSSPQITRMFGLSVFAINMLLSGRSRPVVTTRRRRDTLFENQHRKQTVSGSPQESCRRQHLMEPSNSFQRNVNMTLDAPVEPRSTPEMERNKKAARRWSEELWGRGDLAVA